MWSIPTTAYVHADAAQSFVNGPPPPSQPPPAPGGYGNSNNNNMTSATIPQVPDRFPELEKKNPAELETLLRDDQQFEKFVESLPYTARLKDGLSSLESEVKTLKELNEGKLNENSLSEIRVALDSLKSKESVLLREVNLNRTQRDQLIAKNSPVILLDRLTGASRDIEHETAELQSDFFARKISLQEFTRTYLAKQKKYHEYQAKMEKLREVVR